MYYIFVMALQKEAYKKFATIIRVKIKTRNNWHRSTFADSQVFVLRNLIFSSQK